MCRRLFTFVSQLGMHSLCAALTRLLWFMRWSAFGNRNATFGFIVPRLFRTICAGDPDAAAQRLSASIGGVLLASARQEHAIRNAVPHPSSIGR